MGYSYEHGKVSDKVIAGHTRYTDIIIGGHTHTLLDPPSLVTNIQNKYVTIAQKGSGSVRLGVIQVIFDKESNDKIVECIQQKFLKNKSHSIFFLTNFQ